MQVTPKSRRAARAQTLIFVVLVLAIVGLLTWLSTRYTFQADWTAGGRRSLSDASVQLLVKMQGPVKKTAFARDERDLRQAISDMEARNQRYKNDNTGDFDYPDTAPERGRGWRHHRRRSAVRVCGSPSTSQVIRAQRAGRHH